MQLTLDRLCVVPRAVLHRALLPQEVLLLCPAGRFL